MLFLHDGLVQRIVNSETFPPSTDYVLTEAGKKLIPVLDVLYIWSIRQMDSKGIPIDADAFVVHKTENYLNELGDIMNANCFEPEMGRSDNRKKTKNPYW